MHDAQIAGEAQGKWQAPKAPDGPEYCEIVVVAGNAWGSELAQIEDVKRSLEVAIAFQRHVDGEP